MAWITPELEPCSFRLPADVITIIDEERERLKKQGTPVTRTSALIVLIRSLKDRNRPE